MNATCPGCQIAINIHYADKEYVGGGWSDDYAKRHWHSDCWANEAIKRKNLKRRRRFRRVRQVARVFIWLFA